MTQPRSGTTVTTEMTWLLINNLDYENAKKIRLEERVFEQELGLYDNRWSEAKVAIRNENDPTSWIHLLNVKILEIIMMHM
ncbi:hypothetical protein HCN44_000820 [Aphidius gifuensis]|uniref:Sulfotransferase domain-containing protein n=1 Tax=Aphidius gifuensis TaxID=684658 RepID=A0A834XSE6_APHGI|nr:hypothetical protein HCN44_000820 [Aphidius gifuensis]